MKTTSKLGLIAGALLACHGALAQQSADELAKKLANPVAALISVPFQYNVDFGYGTEDGTKQTLNIQPVIPASIGEDWNLITRVIMPVISQHDVAGNSGTQTGLGDFTPTLFFSPKKPTAGGLIWGIGPVFLLKTASDDELGGGKWGMGPSILGLVQTKAGWTYGLLANHIWSFAGDDDRKHISNTFLQPFLTKNFPGGRTLGCNLESSYNWSADQWNVPLNCFGSKVMKFGSQLVSLQGGLRAYLETPDGGPDWGFRLQLTFLYPR